ncbi:hypothetical protein KJ708_11335 [bacterium]|nr:hypothetical protein [bacterium]MBU1917628.1 hypothetical protein [bacterium]
MKNQNTYFIAGIVSTAITYVYSFVIMAISGVYGVDKVGHPAFWVFMLVPVVMTTIMYGAIYAALFKWLYPYIFLKRIREKAIALYVAIFAIFASITPDKELYNVLIIFGFVVSVVGGYLFYAVLRDVVKKKEGINIDEIVIEKPKHYKFRGTLLIVIVVLICLGFSQVDLAINQMGLSSDLVQ